MSITGPDGPPRDVPARPGPVRGLRLAPFRGLRYVPERVGSLAAVTSPPYDVVVRPDGQRHLETADPYNVVRLILPEGPTAEEQHRGAARTLAAWRENGVLAADPRPAVYVYEQLDGHHLQRGVIGALRLTPPSEGVVLPHEDVMPGPVAERADLMRATGANLEPLLLTYRDGEPTAHVIDRTAAGTRPLIATTTEDGVRHRLWALTDPADLATVRTDLAGHQAMIADGHHRWATYLRLQAAHPPDTAWDFGLVLLVDSARHPLRVRAIHRVLPRLPLEAALTAARDVFRVRTLEGPLDRALGALAEAAAAGNAFLLAGDGFHLLDQPRPERLAAAVPRERPERWRRLDAAVLHHLLLDQVWRVPDAPDHIRYIHDAAAAVEVARRHGGTAVLLHPVREQVVLELARAGEMMPRKSTSFGPKPASGLVMRGLDLG
ncbi:Uncharacterized conserved protein, DUF1015 family [Streptomyces sp. DvalAA-14]|uniref:DUF1015 family protein n=1 Tax=unclassified Streptomyces TaxID=2593676 RepID=UPI00081B4AC1|nr:MULTISPECIES: DUF1015 domain-containing protein [unclassified Streptomyces]MYS22696.1 DUF1015 family protein [Streptomyces sp. SID4948]SCE20714.1 Uncharacterized conserved protein, DUF1015 family [Streptomyces sp. DvalAA-14]